MWIIIQIYSEILYSYELYYAKIFKLYNGNIVMAGDKGIYTYDNTGTNLLITNRVKDFVGLSNSTNYDVIIDGNNVVYEVTTISTSNKYYNISSIDLENVKIF